MEFVESPGVPETVDSADGGLADEDEEARRPLRVAELRTLVELVDDEVRLTKAATPRAGRGSEWWRRALLRCFAGGSARGPLASYVLSLTV